MQAWQAQQPVGGVRKFVRAGLGLGQLPMLGCTQFPAPPADIAGVVMRNASSSSHLPLPPCQAAGPFVPHVQGRISRSDDEPVYDRRQLRLLMQK